VIKDKPLEFIDCGNRNIYRFGWRRIQRPIRRKNRLRNYL